MTGFADPTVDGFVPATGVTTGSAFYNAVRDSPVDPTVPAMIEETGDLVREFLNFNRQSAEDALALTTNALEALVNAALPPDLPDPPPAPTITTSFNAQIGLGFDTDPNFGDIYAEAVAPFTPTSITIPSIETGMPAYQSLGLVPILPDAPTLDTIPEPTEPGLDLSYDIPDAPTANYGSPPDLDEIILPTYVAPVLPVFTDDAPTFGIAAPQPVIQWTEPAYSSTVQDAVRGVLLTMLSGGTGIDPDVELAIWERARAREETTALATYDTALARWTARGHDGPQGQLNRQMLAVDEETARKITELSRDVAIKQADLEQKNRQFAVEQAINYERVFTAVFLAIVDRNFQIAKFAVETQIQIYNAQIAAFNVEQQVYAQQIAKYRVDLEAVLTQLKAFEAQVLVEKAKGELNQAKASVFESMVRAFGEEVNAYEAQVKAADGKAELQKTLVEVYRGQIEAMVAKYNGQRAKFDAYDSQVKGETAKIGMEEANTRAYVAQVQGWAAKNDVYFKRADLQVQENRQQLEWNVANMKRASDFIGQLVQVIQAKVTAFQANTTRASAKYSADQQAKQAELQASVSLSQLAISKYTALLEQWKTRSQEVIQFGLAQVESMRAAAQIASNWLAGAMAGTHVSAGLSGSASAGQTSGRSSTDSTTQSQNVNENSNFTIQHLYQHRV